MEWLVLLLVAAGAAVYILLPRAPGDAPEDAADSLRAQRAGLLELLRELDEDVATGRIAPEDRAAGRRMIAPRLRQVTEALETLGEPREAPAPVARPDAAGPAEPTVETAVQDTRR